MDRPRRIALRCRCLVVALILILIKPDASGADTSTELKFCSNKREVCVPKEQCLDGKINVLGFGLIAPRLGDDVDECEGYDEECCTLPDSYVETTMKTTSTTTTTEETLDYSGWSGQCGERNVSESEPGTETRRWEFPWSVALFSVTTFLGRNKKEFLCGGTLIDDQAVLTAARCVHQQNTSTLRIQVGRWNLDAASEPAMLEIGVEKVVINKHYVGSSQLHNIALLFLDESVSMGRTSNRVCLPDGNKIDATANCYVVGWRNTPSAGTPNTQLKLESYFADPTTCTDSIRSSTGSQQFRLPVEKFCVDYTDQFEVPCERAPGSGMVCALPDNNGQFFLVGIASYALRKCGQYSARDVFLSTKYYISWVDETMRKNSFSNQYYRPELTSF